jgi:hypothetical protein
MRYSDRVIFTKTVTVWDDDQMGYVTSETDDIYPADISQIGVQQQAVIFGDVNQDNRIIRVQGMHKPNKIKVDGKPVTIVKTMYHRNVSDFYVRL